MKQGDHSCDATARAGMWIICFLGLMGLCALLGLLLLAYSKREPSPVVLTAFAGAIGAAMTGLPSLMARMSGQAEHATGKQEDPVHTKEEEEAK